MKTEYQLIDSGDQKKYEQFGPYRLIRPCAGAVWKPQMSWKQVDGHFEREGGNKWKKKSIPPTWIITFNGIKLRLVPTDFGHLGLFPEHGMHHTWMVEKMKERKGCVLNLFAYTGASTLALAKAGIDVCHLDASKGSVNWARENAELNGLEKANIRWIVDDAIKFLKREVKRGTRYDGILLDPPSFGRGSSGQVFKLEDEVSTLLRLCKEVLSPSPAFLLWTSHTPGFTPTTLHHLLYELFQGKGVINQGEMLIPSKDSFSLGAGIFARWSHG